MSNKKYISLPYEKARGFTCGTASVLRLPVEPQPEVDSTGHLVFNGIKAGADLVSIPVAGKDKLCPNAYCIPPYHVGDVLCAREAWSQSDKNTDVIYKADYTAEQLRLPTLHNLPSKWQAPASIPENAIRFHLRVTEVRLEKLENIKVHRIFEEGVWGDEERQKKLRSQGQSGLADNLAWRDYCDRWNKGLSFAQRERLGIHATPWTWVIRLETADDHA